MKNLTLETSNKIKIILKGIYFGLATYLLPSGRTHPFNYSSFAYASILLNEYMHIEEPTVLLMCDYLVYESCHYLKCDQKEVIKEKVILFVVPGSCNGQIPGCIDLAASREKLDGNLSILLKLTLPLA